MKRRARSRSHLSRAISSLLWTFLLLVPGVCSSNIVTLESIQIFTTHDWLPLKPTVYFRCRGENSTVLPDVKETYSLYTFKGEESWQPLTELPEKKCKRCGLYERDNIKFDDVFDEWELCRDDFVDGKCIHFKEKEFNATFKCPMCTSSRSSSTSTPMSGSNGKKTNVVLVIIVSALVSIVIIIGLLAGYKYWQKRKREQDHARFLKLFEEGDDIEDELGLGSVM